MGESVLRTEDRIGIGTAIVLHAALAGVIAWQALYQPASPPPVDRIAVSLATEVSLESTAPDPVPESRAAIAPTLADAPAPPAQESAAETQPETTRTPPPPPPPSRTAQRTPPQRTVPDERPRRRPDPPARTTPERTASQGGGSRIGEDFLEGRGGSTTTDETRAPAATFGRAEQAQLSAAITRQLRPHWNAPSGADAERLVSTVSWRLNQDGSLRGRPTCRTDPGSITESNRPQAALHCERAIRAVQLAAPFNLPEQFYSRWDDLEWQFDRRL